jgi:hypothetical protein
MRTAASVFLLLVTASVPGWSQMGSAQEEEERLLYTIELIGVQAASGYVVSMGCNGNTAPWKRVIDALDLRYQRCVKLGSSLEQAVARHFAREWRYAQAAGTSTDAGTLAFERWLSIRERQFGEDKTSDRCSSLFARTLLKPGSVPKAELEAEYRRYPKFQGDIETVIAMRRLGDDQKWVEAPCDDFFPKK